MSGLKYKYVIGVLNNDHTIDYVSRVDNTTKTFYCEKGEPAKVFSKTVADDLAYGMITNCVTAAVLKVPEFFDLRNRESGEDNDSKAEV